MTDIKYIYAFAVMFAFAGALVIVDAPNIFLVLSDFDLGFFASEIVTIAGACVITTGIPCAIALIFWTVANITAYVVTNNLIQLLFMSPIAVVIIFILSKLARGNG